MRARRDWIRCSLDDSWFRAPRWQSRSDRRCGDNLAHCRAAPTGRVVSRRMAASRASPMSPFPLRRGRSAALCCKHGHLSACRRGQQRLPRMMPAEDPREWRVQGRWHRRFRSTFATSSRQRERTIAPSATTRDDSVCCLGSPVVKQPSKGHRRVENEHHPPRPSSSSSRIETRPSECRR